MSAPVVALIAAGITVLTALNIYFVGSMLLWPRRSLLGRSWERVEFDFANYSRLRNQGLTPRQTREELDRQWEARQT